METILGIPAEGWKAIAVWLIVLVVPWTYGLYFLYRIERSGVRRWGSRAATEQDREGEA